MNILQILQVIAVLIPAAADAVSKIYTAIHSTPGSPEHETAINTKVVPVDISSVGKN